MSTEAPTFEFNIEQVASALFKAKGIKTGLWRVAVKLRFAGITAGFQSDAGTGEELPTGLVGVAGMALFAVKEPGQLVFDAATGKAANASVKGIAVKRKSASAVVRAKSVT